jgi:hypothetical protein
MNKTCEICKGGLHETTDHPFLPTMETHNPMDIPFGHEVHEINKNVKDIDEGGMGSGRQPDYGDPIQKEPTGGELVTFETVPILKLEETINKQLFDQKLKKCPCKNRKA